MATRADNPDAVREAQERWLSDREFERAVRPLAEPIPVSRSAAPPTFWRIAMAVMTGNLLAGAVGTLLYLIVSR